MNRYVFIFDYFKDGGWMILLFKDGDNYKYFNSAEDDWDDSLSYANDFVEFKGNKYHYKIPSFQHLQGIDVFDLKDEPIKSLSEYIK